MIILISGATHSGKTMFSQRILEKYKIPYLSLDHLKMGLIRSNQTDLMPYSPENELTDLLWPITKEMINTAIENNQHMTIEGIYIPYNYKNYFEKDYLKHIKSLWIILSEDYIKNNFKMIEDHSSIIEQRLYPEISINSLIKDNKEILENCIKHDLNYILIDSDYKQKIEEVLLTLFD